VSDIQDIIHTTTIKAYESGVKHEQERIIELLQAADSACSEWAIAIIKAKN
jgi:hypothetical protein